jgi:DNA repair exonuclease SbcCD nuclease subunit
MTRVIHTGDTHLGYQQYHLSERRQDFLDAFRRVIDDAIEDGVDAVVHAGDLFHDRRPGLPDLLGTLSVLRELNEANIPFLAVVGNHETTRHGQWLDLFESMGLATRLSSEPVVVGDTAFYGLDFVPRSRRDELDYEFAPHDATHAALVSHGLFEPLVPDYDNVEWDAREVLSEATVDFDAMLLGDEHAPERAEVDGTWVAYSGSTERASAGERDGRGYNLVEFSDGAAHLSRRGIPTREFVFVSIDLAEGEGVDRVREQVGQYDLVDAVVVVEITGEGEPVAPAQIEEFAAERGALVARVSDRRELAEEAAELDVSFADPDDAVRERLSEMGLSEAARDLDETVRASKIADGNVADTVEQRVRELVDDENLKAFEPAIQEANPEVEAEPDSVDADAAESAGTAGAVEATDEGESEADDATEATAEDPATTGGDGQASMGDFS